jgi:hypothetical protein
MAIITLGVDRVMRQINASSAVYPLPLRGTSPSTSLIGRSAVS